MVRDSMSVTINH